MTDPEMLPWLREAITRRLELAKAACGDPGHPVAWVLEGHGGGSALIRDGYGNVVVYDEGSPADEEAAHIAANDPRDVIARCEAELAMLEWFGETGGKACVAFGDDSLAATLTGAHFRQVQRFLAAGYRHHPGWKAEWAP